MDAFKPAFRGCALLGVLVLGGCSLLNAPWPKAPPPPPPPAPAAPPPEPVLSLPTDTHKFELADPKDDLYGAVQLTTAGKEDTLPDIARRFNVGYEEIVRANPSGGLGDLLVHLRTELRGRVVPLLNDYRHFYLRIRWWAGLRFADHRRCLPPPPSRGL